MAAGDNLSIKTVGLRFAQMRTRAHPARHRRWRACWRQTATTSCCPRPSTTRCASRKPRPHCSKVCASAATARTCAELELIEDTFAECCCVCRADRFRDALVPGRLSVTAAVQAGRSSCRAGTCWSTGCTTSANRSDSTPPPCTPPCISSTRSWTCCPVWWFSVQNSSHARSGPERRPHLRHCLPPHRRY